MGNPMRTVSFKLTQQLDDTLSDLARRRNSTRSALVREALEMMTASTQRSVTARVDELVRPTDGPKDLSTSRKHLTGYGE